MAEKQTTQEQAARRIAGLLAQAESFAKLGNLAMRDTCLQKATALQHQYAIDLVMAETHGQTTEEVEMQDFCEESNTPLIKAKRELIAAVAKLYRGEPALLETTRFVGGKWKRDKRAAIRVWAHASDLRFIAQLYTSLILQMQAEMARDEKLTHEKVTNGWRVSYAHSWVFRVVTRLRAMEWAQAEQETATGSGAEVMLRDKGALVKKHLEDGKLLTGTARRTPRSDNNASGRAAGDAAGWRADLGQKRTDHRPTPALD